MHSTDVHVQKKSNQWWLKGKEKVNFVFLAFLRVEKV